MYLTEQLEQKWAPVLDFDGLPSIKDPYRRAVTALVLENQEKAMAEEGRLLNESAPTNATNGGASPMANYDPILISLVRRALPNLIAYDICGVQPMTGPTGLIFAMKSRYKLQNGTEALFNEANTAFSGQNAAAGLSGPTSGNTSNTNPVYDTSTSATYGVNKGMTTAQAEALGDSADNGFAEMAFSIDKVTVTARSRALKEIGRAHV